MGKKRVTQFLGLEQSLFRPEHAERPRPLAPIGRPEDEPVTDRQKINADFSGFVMIRCAKAGMSSGSKISKAVSSICKRPMAESAAWTWMLDEFLKCHPIYHGDKYRDLVQRARWRIKKIRRQENHAIQKERIERESSVARAQYAEERKANGGEANFFDSNKWQRLRYDVLVASNGCCKLCGRSTREHNVILHVDHIKPRSRFPKLAMERSNLQVLCEDCNLGKSNRDTIDWSEGAGGQMT